MDNFNLQDYLASGKLHATSKTLTEAKKQGYDDREDESLGARKGAENTQNQISSRIVKLGKEAGISSDDIEEYVDGLESSFEPDAYKNITDKELLKDLKLAVKNLAEKADSKKGNESEQKRMEGAIKDDRDHIKNLKKDIESNESKLARLKKDYKRDVIKEDEEEVKETSIMKVSELKAKIKEDILAELSLNEKEEVDVDIDVEDEVEVEAGADDIEIERKGVKAKVEVGLSPEEEIIQDSLKAAMDSANALGNDKLADQIGNTITFFTREYVVGDRS
jgi:hypothetical protein